MSRSYVDCDYEPEYPNAWALQHGAIRRAVKGKRGQAFLRELADAMDAMPEKRLIRGSFQKTDGEVCTLGVLGKARGVDMSKLDKLAREADEDDSLIEYVRAEAAEVFGVADALTGHVMFKNDEGAEYRNAHETPEQRWTRMRAWVAEQIEGPP